MYRVLPPFKYLEPKTIGETIQILSTYGAQVKVLAGGTDLVVSMKKRKVTPQYVVYIKNIPNLDCIEYSEADGLRIGPLATHKSIATSPIIRDKFEVLATACSKIGTPHTRTTGTIGGNICMAGPSQDTPPALLVLDAKLKLVSSEGERIVPIDGFFIAPFKTIIKEAELLTEIQIPDLPPKTAGSYQWTTKRTVVDETLAGVAVLMTLDDNNTCKNIRIGLCSVAPTSMRAKRAEEVLKGRKLEDKLIEEAAQTAMYEARPRSRADYRRRMTGILVKKAINEAWQKIRQEIG